MQTKENSLAKNTIALYIRMLFSVCINIYISRVVLDVLGVRDFGIYSVVGGVVGLLGFINSSMSGATSRFLSIALGENNKQKLTDTYNAAKHLHLGIAILIFILSETIGLLIVNTYLKLPDERMLIANYVYQLSIFTTIFSILQVPYSSLIISVERMDVYAKIEIAKILLKLFAVLCLSYFFYDRLLMYGILLLLVSIMIYLIYVVYCYRHYPEYPFSKKIDLNIIRPMLYFSGWDMLGWGGFSLNTQGRQIFMNRFFGVAMNTANGMATTASGAIMAFTNNVVMAFRPRIVKYYAAERFNDLQRMMEIALFSVILLMSILIVPMFYSMDFLLNLWLVEVPEHTLEFCKLLLLFQFSEVISTVVKIGIHASGKMRFFTIAGFLIQALNIFFTYLLYKLGFPALSTFIIAVVLSVTNLVINLYFLHVNIKALIMHRIIMNIVYGTAITCGGFLLGYLMVVHTEMTGLANFIVIGLINAILIIAVSIIKYSPEIRIYLHNFKS